MREARLRRDRVHDPDVGQPRRSDGEQAVDRHRDQPGREDRVAQRLVDRERAVVEEDQHRRDHAELGDQIEVVEHPDASTCRRARCCTDASTPMPSELSTSTIQCALSLADGEIADRHEARDAVDEVGEQEEPDLRAGPGEKGSRSTLVGRRGEAASMDLKSKFRLQAVTAVQPPERRWGLEQSVVRITPPLHHRARPPAARAPAGAGRDPRPATGSSSTA